MTAGAEPSVLPKSQKGAAPVRAQGRRRKEHNRHMGNLPWDRDDILQILARSGPQP